MEATAKLPEMIKLAYLGMETTVLCCSRVGYEEQGAIAMGVQHTGNARGAECPLLAVSSTDRRNTF